MNTAALEFKSLSTNLHLRNRREDEVSQSTVQTAGLLAFSSLKSLGIVDINIALEMMSQYG